MTAVPAAARVAGLLAVGLAVALAWTAVVVLGGGSVAGSARALAGAGLLRPDSLATVASAAAPLLLAGLAVAVGLCAGTVNLGVQGQALAGATAATLVAERLHVRVELLLPLAVAAGMAAGLAWALPPALLRAWCGVPEPLTTVLASFMTVAVVAALPFASRPADVSPSASIGSLAVPLRHLAGNATWPSLLTWTVPSALLAALVLVVAMRGSSVGTRLRALLAEPRAALVAGVRPGVAAVAALLLSGAVAGLAGLQDVLGPGAPVAGGLGTVATAGAAPVGSRSLASVPLAHLPDYGLLAVAVALAGRASGLGMAAAALALAFIDHAGVTLGPAAGLPPEAAAVLQAVLVVAAVVAARLFRALTGAYQARSAWFAPAGQAAAGDLDEAMESARA